MGHDERSGSSYGAQLMSSGAQPLLTFVLLLMSTLMLVCVSLFPGGGWLSADATLSPPKTRGATTAPRGAIHDNDHIVAPFFRAAESARPENGPAFFGSSQDFSVPIERAAFVPWCTCCRSTWKSLRRTRSDVDQEFPERRFDCQAEAVHCPGATVPVPVK